jgi:hypothetical protein
LRDRACVDAVQAIPAIEPNDHAIGVDAIGVRFGSAGNIDGGEDRSILGIGVPNQESDSEGKRQA